MRRLLIGLLLASLAALPAAASDGPPGGWLEPVKGFFSQLLEMLESPFPALGPQSAAQSGPGAASVAACGALGRQGAEIGPRIEPNGVAGDGPGAASEPACGTASEQDEFGPCIEPHG